MKGISTIGEKIYLRISNHHFHYHITSTFLPVVTLLLIAMTVAAEQTQRGTSLLAPLNLKLGTLAERATMVQSEDLTMIERTLDSTTALEKRLNDSVIALPLEYSISIKALEEEVPEISAIGEKSNPRIIEKLSYINKDLQRKNKYLAGGLGGMPFFKSLMVRVRVMTFKKNGSPVNGYTVWVNPVRDSADGKHRFSFSSTTNASQRLLPPGIYVLTLSRGSTIILRKEVDVGEGGKEEQIIEHYF